MGPPSDTASVFGSSNASEWGKEYEDEDTWYEWSSAYQVGPETNLLPSKDIGLGVRMAKYRRNVGGTTTVRTSRPRFNIKLVFPVMWISIIKIRRSWDKTVVLCEF